MQAGPYVQSDTDDIKVAIPSDLQKDERTFYLMTTDDSGDIVILSNASTDDGTFEAAGTAGTDYMMIFEDGETPLESMITDDGVFKEDIAEHKSMALEKHKSMTLAIAAGIALLGALGLAFVFRRI